MVAIMAEEAGESLRVAIDLVYNNGSLDNLKKEIAQN